MVTMTSNTTPPPYVASASAEVDADHRAYKAFDNDVNSEWMGGGGAPWYLQFDWGAGTLRVLGRYTVSETAFFAFLFPARTPNEWQIEGSLDAITWFVIDFVTGQTGWDVTPVRSFQCDVETDAYRYFRMTILTNNGDPDFSLVTEFGLGGQPNKFY